MAALQNYQVTLASGDGTAPVFKGDAEGGLYLKTAGLGDKTLMVVSGGLYQKTPDQAAIDLAPYCAADYAAYQKESGLGHVRGAPCRICPRLRSCRRRMAGGGQSESLEVHLRKRSHHADGTRTRRLHVRRLDGGGLAQPTKDVTIPQGSQGDRDYTAT